MELPTDLLTTGRPLRIMQLVSSPTTSGPCVHVLELSHLLRQLGHQITIVALPSSWIAKAAVRLGFDTITSHQYRFPPNEIWKLRQAIKERKIDVLHTHMSRAHFLGVLLRGLCQVPCIATAHCRKIQAHWMWNNHVIATSRDTERFHRRYNLVSPDRISTIYSPTPRRRYEPEVSEERPFSPSAIATLRAQWECRPGPSQPAVLGVVGEISLAKGQLFLLQALQQLLAAGRSVRLVVIGNHRESYVAELKKQARALGIADAIHWAGFCDRIPLAMAALDIYVCPSLSESLPLTLLEAMTAAKPIVATQVGGIPEIIQDQHTGLLVPPKDSQALASSIARLLDHPDLSQRLGQQARQKTQQEFDPVQQTLKVLRIYERFVFDQQDSVIPPLIDTTRQRRA